MNYSIRVFREEMSYGNYGLIVQGRYFALSGGPRRAVQGWEVGDPRVLRPLEIETIINSVKKTGKVLIVDVAVKNGGFGRGVPSPNNRDLDKASVTQVEDSIE